jgi:small conductance mechanosensitive channel
MPISQEFAQTVATWFWDHGVRVVLIVFLAVGLMRLKREIIRRAFSRIAGEDESEGQKRADTLGSLLGYVVSAAILIVAATMVLGELGVSIGPVLAAAGIVGIAVGFGSQQLVQDVVSGFFILMEDQIRVGDVVEVAGHAGLVEGVTLRTTRLRDLSGSVHYIRNGKIDVVSNMTKEFSFYLFETGVAYREDVDEVISVLKQVDEALRSDPDFADHILEPLEVFGIDKFADSAVVIKSRVKTKPIQQWRVGREFNARLKKRFDELGIEIPFPHLTLYMGQDKHGNAPAMAVRLTNNQGGTGAPNA